MTNTSIACIVCNNNKVLIAHRINCGAMGGRWEFPGGKCEADEDCPTAIAREMSEEFGVVATVKEHITQGHFIHDGADCTLQVYRVNFSHDGLATPYTLSEHTEYRWVDIDDVQKYNFVDSDLSIYPAVKKYLRTH